jgi:iron complex outermembrane receptor protein
VVYGKVAVMTNAFDVKLLGSHQDIQQASDYDFDGSPLPLAAFESKKQYGDITTGELQFLSNSDSWGSDWLTWIAGGYYFESTQGFDPVVLQVAETDLSRGQVLGMVLPDSLLSLVQPLYESGLPIPSGVINVTNEVYTESVAGFMQVSAAMTDWMSLTVGGRYQSEKRTLVESTAQADGTPIAIQSFGTDRQPALRMGTVDGGNSRTIRSFKPKVSLDFRPEAAWLGESPLLYLSWQEALKAAAVNSVKIYDAPNFVEPEKLTAYEAGFKTSLLDGLVRLSAAVFYYDISNLQVQFISLLQGGTVTFENAGGAEIKGADFDATISLLPELIDGFVMTLGGAYLDSQYTDYDHASGFGPVTGLLTTNNDYAGNQIARTPKFSGTLGLSKIFNVPGGTLEAGGDIYHNSGFYYSAQNEDFTEEDAYTVVGARVSYLYEPWHLRLTAFGRNLTDEYYNIARFPTDFGTSDSRAAPRMYGLRLNWDY